MAGGTHPYHLHTDQSFREAVLVGRPWHYRILTSEELPAKRSETEPSSVVKLSIQQRLSLNMTKNHKKAPPMPSFPGLILRYGQPEKISIETTQWEIQTESRGLYAIDCRAGGNCDPI
jgi:hypothetical protein